MSTFIAASSGPQSHLAPRVRGDARRLQESRVRCVAASRYTSPCPRGTGSLSRRRDRGYHAPIRTPASLGRGQPKLLEQPPSGGLPPALRLRGSLASTYPASRRGSNGAKRGWRTPMSILPSAASAAFLPVMGRWKLFVSRHKGCLNRPGRRGFAWVLTHSGFLSVLCAGFQKKPPVAVDLLRWRPAASPELLASACAAWVSRPSGDG